MGKRQGPSKNLEDAMADALAAVERAEKGAPPQVDAEDTEPDNGPFAVDEPETQEGPASATTQAPAETPVEPDPETALRDQLLRLAADFENYRKRAQREAQDARRFGVEKLLGDLLIVVDNLERALAHATDDKNPVIEGVRMVAKQFKDTLGNYGARGFVSLGQPFDPERHQAVGQAPGGDLPPGTVLEEIAAGYFLHDRLLRPAQVIVAAARQEDKGDVGAN